MADTKLYIDGRWRNGRDDRRIEVVDPAAGEPAGSVSAAGPDDVAAATDAARRAFAAWGRTRPEHRGEILLRAAAALAERGSEAALALTSEQGKTLAESRAEVARAVETLRWHAEAASRICAPRDLGAGTTVRPEPLGVVAAFTPWNYPAVIVARKLGAALAAGCTVVLKAAEETPAIAAAIVGALDEAGLPPGVVNLVFGDPPRISDQLLEAPEVRALSFTGSTAVGRRLAERAGRKLMRCVLELGGHAPVLVFDDADVPAAAEAVAAYKFECAGQSCNAPSRIYVHASVHAEFADALVRAARRIRVGDGRDPSTDMGPMASPRRLDAMERLTADAVEHGAAVLTGGRRLDRPGWFWPPTVLTGVGDGARLLTEEPFGPVAPVWSFRSFDEAIARANANPYGLAAYVFTASDETAALATTALDAGSVGVNELRGVSPDVGIAGVKDSGFGYEGGQPGVEAFLNLKVVRGTAARPPHPHGVREA